MIPRCILLALAGLVLASCEPDPYHSRFYYDDYGYNNSYYGGYYPQREIFVTPGIDYVAPRYRGHGYGYSHGHGRGSGHHNGHHAHHHKK